MRGAGLIPPAPGREACERRTGIMNETAEQRCQQKKRIQNQSKPMLDPGQIQVIIERTDHVRGRSAFPVGRPGVAGIEVAEGVFAGSRAQVPATPRQFVDCSNLNQLLPCHE